MATHVNGTLFPNRLSMGERAWQSDFPATTERRAPRMAVLLRARSGKIDTDGRMATNASNAISWLPRPNLCVADLVKLVPPLADPDCPTHTPGRSTCNSRSPPPVCKKGQTPRLRDCRREIPDRCLWRRST